MEHIVQDEIKAAQERADLLNNSNLSKSAIKQQVSEIHKIGNESYLSYQYGKFVVNDMIGKLQLYSFLITNVVYNSDKSLRDTYGQNRMIVTKGKWHIAPEKFVKDLIKEPTLEIYTNGIAK